MKRIALLLLCIATIAFAAPSTEVKTPKPAPSKIQDPMLWEITGNGLEKPSWLFGTIHIGDSRITGGNTNKGITTSELVNQAFQKADTVFVEIDTSDPKVANEAMKLSRLPAGKTIADVVNPKTVSLVKKTIEHIIKQIPMLAQNPKASEIFYTQFSTMKPIMLSVTLELLPIMMKNPSPALDMLICTKAKKSGKKLLSLETPQQQIASFDVLTSDEQQKVLASTCEDVISGESSKKFSELLNAYLCGNIKKFEAIMDREKQRGAKLVGQKIIDKLHYSLVDKRNDGMVRNIKKSLTDDPDSSYFVAVGAAHMIGKTGLVEQLQKAGYTVKRVTTK